MKKMWMLGMAAAMVLQATVAQAGKGGVHEITRDAAKRARDKGAIVGLKETTKETIDSSTGDLLLNVAKIADPNDMQTAVRRTIEVKDGEKVVSVNLGETARTIITVQQDLVKINRNDLDAKQKQILEVKEELAQVSAQMIGLAAKTTATGRKLSADEQLQLDAFNKTLSLIPEMLTTMDVREMQSHMEIMKLAIAFKTNPSVKGEYAFAQALKQKYGEKAKEKMDEILGCIKG